MEEAKFMQSWLLGVEELVCICGSLKKGTEIYWPFKCPPLWEPGCVEAGRCPALGLGRLWVCYLPSGTGIEPQGDGTVEETKGAQWRGEKGREVVPWESQAF